MTDDTLYMYRLPSGIVHQSESLDFIAKTYPDAIITDRITLDDLGAAVFHPFTGKQPYERAVNQDDGEADAEGPQVEVERAEGDQVAAAEPVAEESPKPRARR